LIFAFVLSGYNPAYAESKLTENVRVTKKQTSPDINYVVGMSKPWTHLLEVEMNVKWSNMPGKFEVKMPVWTPGSYLVREYARHVQDFTALDGNGNPLDWEKKNKNTWEIDTKGAKDVRVGYRVYSNDLTVRTNELNYEHAFFTPAALLMFPKGQIQAPSTVKINPYENWKVATGLKSVAGQTNTFRATNYDVLYDSPFEVSDFIEKKFTVQGKPHRYIVTGEGNYDLDQIVTDTTKIIEECYKMFGELPYEDYTFILNLRGGGGLEHLNSTALQFNRWAFENPAGYRSFLGLVAHEFFHLYNVKRLRPEPLGPFDYENENYTKLLWVAEGTTSYYEWVLMNRAGIYNHKDVLSNAARIGESLERQPGRFQTSLEEASFDAWIKSYRPDEHSVNRQISYYSKGELVNFLLDIKIRTESKGAKSLDDVMTYLYGEFFKKRNKTYSPEDFQKACEMMAGTSLDDFFKKYVSGREEIEYNSILNDLGLQLVKSSPENDQPYLGANVSEVDGGMRISSIPAGTPAYQGKLNADDLLVAIDGHQITSSRTMDFHINRKKAGDTIKVTLFRHNKLHEFDVTLGKTPASGYTIVPMDNPSDEHKRLYQSYLGASLN
jgi:predicted metalloprotease with PDZ domain